MTSIVSLSTPLPKNKNNIPSFSSSPTAIKISDGSPCQIIRKDDICYLIKADNGKEEFVFEDEIKIIESPSQSSNLQSPASISDDNDNNDNNNNTKEVGPEKDNIVDNVVEQDENRTYIESVYNGTFGVINKTILDQWNTSDMNNVTRKKSNKKISTPVRSFKNVEKPNDNNNNNNIQESNDDKKSSIRKNINKEEGIKKKKKKKKKKNVNSNMFLPPKCGPKSYKNDMILTNHNVEKLKVTKRSSPRLRRRTDTENSIDLEKDNNNNNNNNNDDDANNSNEAEEHVEEIEERPANLPGSPHPSSRLRSNMEYDISANRNTTLSPTQTLMVDLNGKTLLNSPSSSLLSPSITSPSNEDDDTVVNKSKKKYNKKKKKKKKKKPNKKGNNDDNSNNNEEQEVNDDVSSTTNTANNNNNKKNKNNKNNTETSNKTIDALQSSVDKLDVNTDEKKDNNQKKKKKKKPGRKKKQQRQQKIQKEEEKIQSEKTMDDAAANNASVLLAEEEEGGSDVKSKSKKAKSKAAAKRRARQRKRARQKKQQQQKNMEAEEKEGTKGSKTDVNEEEEASVEPEEPVVKNVRFKEVIVREFEREIGGGGGVPGQGSWSLGLGTLKSEYIIGTVDEFEARRAKELEDRTNGLSDPHLRKICNGETRQFSHRSGASNPLMGRRSEKERKVILKENILGTDDENILVDEDVFNEKIAEDKKEVYALRKSRQHANQGCDCSLSNAKKIPTKKLKELLRFHGIAFDEEKDKKKSVLQKLYIEEVLRKIGSCCDRNCQCFVLGVPCHDVTCLSLTARRAKDKIKCANPNGWYKYDPDLVEKHRMIYCGRAI